MFSDTDSLMAGNLKGEKLYPHFILVFEYPERGSTSSVLANPTAKRSGAR
jgi:hypothetical protein